MTFDDFVRANWHLVSDARFDENLGSAGVIEAVQTAFTKPGSRTELEGFSFGKTRIGTCLAPLWFWSRRMKFRVLVVQRSHVLIKHTSAIFSLACRRQSLVLGIDEPDRQQAWSGGLRASTTPFFHPSGLFDMVILDDCYVDGENPEKEKRSREWIGTRLAETGSLLELKR